jgi:predicted nuclease with RNAse H fold
VLAHGHHGRRPKVPDVITVGVDLATQPAKTGLAVIEWQRGGAVLASLRTGVTDDDIVAAVRGVDKLGIDCPLGWPDDFIAFITAHAAGRSPEAPDRGDDQRRRLAFRQTDRHVKAAGHTPLSVAADRIGLTAMRAAVILDRLAAVGVPVDRSGAGVVAEVYPAASLQQWGLPHRQYKRDGNRDSRGRLVEELRERAPWLDLGGYVPLCVESDDALDAVVAALTARAAALGRCAGPPPSDLDRARREGWILVPAGRLDDLVGADEASTPRVR